MVNDRNHKIFAIIANVGIRLLMGKCFNLAENHRHYRFLNGQFAYVVK